MTLIKLIESLGIRDQSYEAIAAQLNDVPMIDNPHPQGNIPAPLIAESMIELVPMLEFVSFFNAR